MGDYPLEKLAERIGNEFRKIRVGVRVLPDELCKLGAEPVRERPGVYYVEKFVVVVPESLADKGIHMFWHVASDIVRYQAFPEIGAAAFVSEDEAAGIHVVTLVMTVIETSRVSVMKGYWRGVTPAP